MTSKNLLWNLLCAKYFAKTITYMQSVSWEMLVWKKYKLESRLLGEISINSESEEELKSLLMKVKEESERLKTQKMKIMASGPIISWQIDGEAVETVRNFILGGSKITADGDCSHEIKRHLLLRRKAMINPDSMLKSRDITLSTNICLVKAIIFPVVMYGCES